MNNIKIPKTRIKTQGIWELILLLTTIPTLGLIYSIKIPLMGDEVLTYYLGSLGSLSLVYQALTLGADSHGPIYHTLNWGWTQLGNKLSANPELWTRFPSTIFITTALILLKLTIDSKIQKPIGLLLVVCLLTWEGLLAHLGENRSYGLVLLLVCSQIYFAQNYSISKHKKWLLSMAAITGVSILSHPMAFAYNIATAIALTLGLCLFKHSPKLDIKPLMYTCLGTLALIPWSINYCGQIQSTMSNTVKWASPPTLYQLFEFTKFNNGLILILLIIILTISYEKLKGLEIRQVVSLWLLIGLSFAALSATLWVVSQWSNPLFLERYLIPNQIGLTLLVGSIMPLIFKNKLSKGLEFTIYTIIAGIFLYIFMLPIPTRKATGGFSNGENPWVEAGFGDEKYFTQPFPIVCESSTIYLPRRFYHSNNKDYTLVLNKDIAQKTGGVWMMDYNMNQSLKKADVGHNVKTWEQILNEHTSFYLFNEEDALQDSKLDPRHYKRTLLNPNGKGNLKIELIELIELISP